MVAFLVFTSSPNRLHKPRQVKLRFLDRISGEHDVKRFPIFKNLSLLTTYGGGRWCSSEHYHPHVPCFAGFEE